MTIVQLESNVGPQTRPLIFPRRGTYAITPDIPLTEALLSKIDIALNNGIQVIQYRHKTFATADTINAVIKLRGQCHARQIPLIINDDVELAYRVGADGVHLGKDDLDYRQILQNNPRRLWVGVSCYDSLDRARDAIAAGADYIAFGRFFPSTTKPLASPCSLAILQRAAQLTTLPIVAIGGITPDNGRALLAAGANLLATVEGIFGQSDCGAAARRFQQLFN
jgi:thiamine-phosphate pyrophosphorylase